MIDAVIIPDTTCHHVSTCAYFLHPNLLSILTAILLLCIHILLCFEHFCIRVCLIVYSLVFLHFALLVSLSLLTCHAAGGILNVLSTFYILLSLFSWKQEGVGSGWVVVGVLVGGWVGDTPTCLPPTTCPEPFGEGVTYLPAPPTYHC